MNTVDEIILQDTHNKNRVFMEEIQNDFNEDQIPRIIIMRMTGAPKNISAMDILLISKWKDVARWN